MKPAVLCGAGLETIGKPFRFILGVMRANYYKVPSGIIYNEYHYGSIYV